MRFIFICSDESKNAGARDYAMSMAHELQAQGLPPALACKIGNTQHTQRGLKDFISDNKYYAILPLYDGEKILREFPEDETCVFIGLGENTIDAICDIYDRLEGSPHHFAFVSHILEPSQREVLRAREITAFTPSDIKRHDISHVRISAVPHTATTPILMHHAAEMLKHGDERIADMINLREEFAIAVLNAGFDVENDLGESVYVPYSEEEAYEHGRILGGMMPKNTNLILADGGPRNLRDIAESQQTGLHFLAGYYEANGNNETAPSLFKKVMRKTCLIMLFMARCIWQRPVAYHVPSFQMPKVMAQWMPPLCILIIQHKSLACFPSWPMHWIQRGIVLRKSKNITRSVSSLWMCQIT